MYWEVSVWMLITLQSYNRLIPKNCENRHFDVEAEVVPFCPMSHRWDKWDKWDKWDNRRPTGDGRYLERKQSDKPKSIEIGKWKVSKFTDINIY